MQEILFDIETALDEDLFNRCVEAGFIELPRQKTYDECADELKEELSLKYKKEETIAKYFNPEAINEKLRKESEATFKIKRDYALNPLFAKIKIVSLWTPADGYFSYTDENLTEREIIELVTPKLMHAMPIVTFNGTAFDFPVWLSRAEITNANINYAWIAGIVEGTANRGQHVDLFRAYKYTQGKSNLSLQLFVRGFGKKQTIDYANVSMQDFIVYAKDEMEKMVKWWCLRSGRDIVIDLNDI